MPAFALNNLLANVHGYQIAADFAVEKPCLIGLVGASGAGKSTLLSLIAGIFDVIDGQIIINNNDVSHQKPHQRGVDLLFQHDNLFPHLTLMQNYMLGQPKITTQIAQQSLQMVGLAGFDHKKPAQCSGGELKRAGLARILCRPRACWLLDEPLSGLHPALRRQLLNDIKQLQRNLGIMVILSSHEPDLMNQCDYCAFMDKGKVQIFDRPAVVFASPYCRDYI